MNQDLVDFLERLLGRARKYSNGEMEFLCVFCNHHKKKLAINIKTLNWHCWVCCKSGRGLESIIRKVGNQEDLEKYNLNFKINSKDTEKIQQIQFESIKLPKDFVCLAGAKFFGADRLINYLLNIRKIDFDDILRYKIGTCTGQQYYMNIVFPSFDRFGEINYFTARSLSDGRYSLPPSERGYKNKIVINELNIDWSKPLVVVEGFFDAIKTGIDNVTPLLGSLLSNKSKLFEQVVKNRTELIFALDPDAKEKQLQIIKQFMAFDVMCYTVDVEPYKDVGEMSKKEFKLRFEAAKPINNNVILRERMRNI